MVLLALLVPVALVLGIALGGHPSVLPGFIRNALVSDDGLSVVDETFDAIQDSYYRPITRDELVNTGLAGSVKSLHDRFSQYLDPKSYREFARSARGSFSGIGVTVSPDRRGLRVSEVIKGSPADERGFKVGDVITAVNGRSIAGVSSQVSTARIRGEAGTSVLLTLVASGRRRQVRVRREDIKVPIVKARTLYVGGKRVQYVRLTTFNAEGAHAQVGQAIRSGIRKGAKAVILDLRGNGGGLLEEGVLTGSLFIRKGPIVITDGRAQPRRVFKARGGAIPRKIPVVVLTDIGTASASEIVAGAIQDTKRGVIVGTRTFGKGVFQQIRPLSNGGALDITVGQYFLPSGRNLGGKGVREGKGLTPDVRARDDPKTKRDEAVRAALRVLEQQSK
jgi:carboxyl-terminal processing protease